MDGYVLSLIEKLENDSSLSAAEYEALISGRSEEAAAELQRRAALVREAVYGRDVYLRGLIEISSFCKNDCYYCGIRRSNGRCERYRLTAEEILGCAARGYVLGFRTFVLQGGEDAFFSDDMLAEIISELKRKYADAAVTLSLGERSRESYERLFAAGADRYLLRHETADRAHYEKLHPREASYDNRMRCLRELKEIGFQTGCGFMVGSPYQTAASLAADLKFIEEFRPHMCGIGPFIPHRDTPFAAFAAGSAELTCYLLSIIRLIVPAVLLPATTALATAEAGGRERGLKAGANVVMPNLSPPAAREKYELYDNKLHTGAEDAESVALLKEKISSAGFKTVCCRGDPKPWPQ